MPFFSALEVAPVALAMTYWIHSTLLLGGLWAYLRLRGASHAVEERLWKAAVLLPLLTATLQCTLPSPWPAFNVASYFHDANDEPIARYDVPEPTSYDAAVFEDIAADPVEAPAYEELGTWDRPTAPLRDDLANVNNEQESLVPASATPLDLRATAWRQGCGVLLIGVLVVGCLALLRTALKTHLGLRAAIPLGGDAREALDRLCARLGVRRRVDLLESRVVAEPCSTGVRRWRVLLPRGVGDHLRGEELDAVLAHELAHLHRGDGLWLWIGAVATTVLAFQPLNRLAQRRWRRAAEFQCDEWAVEQGVSRWTLARCLTEMAERRTTPSSTFACLAVSGESGHLTQRVERLVAQETPPDDRERRKRMRRAGAVLLIAAIACVAAAPRVEFESREAADIEDETPNYEEYQPEQEAPFEEEAFDEHVSPEPHAATPSEDPIAVLRRAVAQLDDETAWLDGELARLQTALRRRATGTGDEEAVASLFDSLERLRSRAESIRERRDELVFLVNELDRSRREP